MDVSLSLSLSFEGFYKLSESGGYSGVVSTYGWVGGRVLVVVIKGFELLKFYFSYQGENKIAVN